MPQGTIVDIDPIEVKETSKSKARKPETKTVSKTKALKKPKKKSK